MCVLEWRSCPGTKTPVSKIYTEPTIKLTKSIVCTAAHHYSFINVWFWLIALSGVLIGKMKLGTCEINCTKAQGTVGYIFSIAYSRQGISHFFHVCPHRLNYYIWNWCLKKVQRNSPCFFYLCIKFNMDLLKIPHLKFSCRNSQIYYETEKKLKFSKLWFVHCPVTFSNDMILK